MYTYTKALHESLQPTGVGGERTTKALEEGEALVSALLRDSFDQHANLKTGKAHRRGGGDK